ncbi:hypothetical protein KUTeg_023363 [Tegillarca granosa]|uniref:FAD-binding PCMH-type domain-containing protein n=1 Tax=Tegillarca granosa TaxID=220873 RepID=A0ABQ9E1G0_TEGGR|nr:hypothetical protein KUTeg_023363 [Tegillarca granosa]
MDTTKFLAGVIECPVCRCSHIPNKNQLTNGVYAANCENCGHFFKFRATSGLASEITLTVNGKKYKVGSEYSASTSLNTFLRQSRVSVGTKHMCNEGGCGACMVTAKIYEPISDSRRSYAINSCLCPVFMCDGWEITTIEGLDDKGNNSIPKRLASYNGSQCGFCSCANVMNMHALLDYHAGAVTMKQVEDAYDGYRPILDAMKSFALDSTSNKTPGKMIDIEVPKQIVLADAVWHKPTTVDELFKILNQEKGKKVRITFGNSGSGVFKQLDPKNYDVLIDIRGIKVLYGIDFDSTIVLGAALSINQLRDITFRGRTEPGFTDTFTQMYNMLSKVANQGIRNMASWGGNLMLKHQFPDFASDIYVVLEAANAKLQIADASGPNEYSLTDFLKLDMTDKLLLCMLLSSLDASYHIRCYKVMKRHQNVHAYVNAGIRMNLDQNNGYTVKEKPCIVFGGISKTFNHAVNTENFLTGKQLKDPAVIKGALSTLASEVVPETAPVLSSAAYRKNLTLSLLYRYFLDVLGDQVSLNLRSGATPLERPLSSGQQSYGTDTMEWPVSEPMTKVEALNQNMPGVVKFVSAKDIPGENNIMSEPFDPEELFASRDVGYCGQAVGLIVADMASSKVKVTYTDIKPPLLSLAEAIAKQSFFDKKLDDVVVGDAEGAISKSARKVSGSISMGTQYHFHMETQIAICVPTEDGMDVDASTQWIQYAQQAIAQVCGTKDSSLYLKVRRLGGAYGGKISRNFPVSAACGLAAYLLDKPVRLRLDFHKNMDMMGKRFPYQANYEVGFTEGGKLNGVKITYYADCGISPSEHAMPFVMDSGDNAYHCENWHMISKLVKTNKPANTSCRSPGTAIANKWKKKGLSVVPMRFYMSWNTANFMHTMTVYAGDGSVAIATGGIESGQGLNTKVAAYELGIPMDMIKIKPTNTISNANSMTTGGSVTSELCCQAIIECCNQLKARMAPVKAKMTNPTWKKLRTLTYLLDIEVELDVLTGEHQIVRADILYDCGESLNPEIDVGQEYKPPLAKDIPIDFRIQLLKNAPNPLGVLRSKAVAEPPLCMSCSALFAIKHAVEAARKDNNHDVYFPLNGPATVEAVQTSCMLDPSQFVITNS